MIDFLNYHPQRRAELVAIAQTPQWREALAELGDIEQARKQVRVPPSAPSPFRAPVGRLTALNEPKVKALIAAGERDRQVLEAALLPWPDDAAAQPPAGLSFLGLNLSMDCNFTPRCLYCNQRWVEPKLDLADWKRTIEGALPQGDGERPYVYLTGGEPLLLEDQVWGPQGLIEFAVKRGCAVNLNTNAALISPHVALRLVQAGLSKVHVSLDTPDPAIQDELAAAPGRHDQVLAGIANLQIAREALGADHPKIHLNCVLTRRNLFQFPQLVEFLLRIKQQPIDRPDAPIKKDPNFSDFLIHAIPIGGQENADLRPSKEEFQRFFTEVWDQAGEVWRRYQEALGLPTEEQVTLDGHGVFTNPYLRVKYRGSLEDYCELAATGVYSQLALCDRCYVGPCQGFVLPDGSQYWCGAHTVSRPEPLGNVRDATVQENIARSLPELRGYPNECCRNCAGATLAINQGVEQGLRTKLDEWLAEADGLPAPAAQ
jgi:sulfatase maturation enzyme AslB (radical SAM superfamily)